MIPYFSIQIIKIGPLTFYSWGFFIALAFLAGLILSMRAGKKLGIEAGKKMNLVIFIYLGAIIGSRLFYILQMPRHFFRFPLEIFSIEAGGMMFWGGLFGGAAAGFLYLKKLPNRGMLTDVLAPIVPLAMAIGRIGCFLNNDHVGALTNLPWAIRWPDGSLRHPVALYLILFDLALFGILLFWRRKSKFPGQIFLMFLIFYSASRFFLDFSRDASADPHFFGLATSQWISGLILTVSILYVMLKNRKKEAYFQNIKST